MASNRTDIDAFVRAFIADPGGREALVARLVADEGRLLLNIPGRGIARIISERLRVAPFSAFYDFEMLLAKTLHPRCADLKLNVIADITVNSFFDEKYRMYAADAAAALRQGGGMGPLREVIVRMVGSEGHRMALKFCDIVVKWADPSLYRTQRPIEACVMDMKEGRSAGGPPRLGRVTALFETFAAREGKAAARLLLERMDWDDDLREFVPGLQEELYADGEEPAEKDDTAAGGLSDWQEEEAGAESDREEVAGSPAGETSSDAGSGGAASPRTRTEKYAQILKNEYLDTKDPGDDEGIRRLVARIEEKNGAAFGKERAAEIVDDVLAIWSADPSLDGGVRYLIDTMREERGRPPENATIGEEEALTLPDDTLLQEGSETAVTEEAPAGEEPVSSGEMEALLGEIETETVADDLSAKPDDIDGEVAADRPNPPAADAGQEPAASGDGIFLDELDAEFAAEEQGRETTASSVQEEDSFLLDDLINTATADHKSTAGSGHDDVYLIGEAGEADGLPGEDGSLRGSEPGERDPVGSEPGDMEQRNQGKAPDHEEQFKVQDEILFLDDPEIKKKTRYQRPRKGTRITKIEISEPEHDK